MIETILEYERIIGAVWFLAAPFILCLTCFRRRR